MFRRPSLGSIVTTMTAATVLVGGADLASYAATGHPLVLGHANSAVGTTSLKNVGRGPALSLDSAKSSSPLTVNSSTLVKHLNANSVQGMTARKLEPRTIRFHLGAPGVTFAGSTVHIFTAKVPKGTYQIGMTGLITEPTSSPVDAYTCLVADKASLLAVLQGHASKYSGVYAVDGDEAGSFRFGIVDTTNPAQELKSSTIAFGCSFGTTGPYKVRRALTFTLRPVTAQDKSGKKLPLPRSDVRRLARALR